MPRLKMTRTAKVALYALGIYLVVLLALLGVRFLQVFK
jgi:hypothetical protein